MAVRRAATTAGEDPGAADLVVLVAVARVVQVAVVRVVPDVGRAVPDVDPVVPVADRADLVVLVARSRARKQFQRTKEGD